MQHKELGATAKAAAELATLRREQLALERSSGQSLFLGLSLSATLAQCLRLGHDKQAASLRRAFAVGEARWWWLRLRMLAEGRDWEGLQGLAEEKRAPVAGGGWGPLLEAARRVGAPREVMARWAAAGAAGSGRLWLALPAGAGSAGAACCPHIGTRAASPRRWQPACTHHHPALAGSSRACPTARARPRSSPP
jgi:hypothetical protein